MWIFSKEEIKTEEWSENIENDADEWSGECAVNDGEWNVLKEVPTTLIVSFIDADIIYDTQYKYGIDKINLNNGQTVITSINRYEEICSKRWKVPPIIDI